MRKKLRTASGGNEPENSKLSIARAKAVEKHLLSKGFPSEKIEVRGFGSSSPVSRGTSEEERQKNRRVTFSLK